MYIYIYIYITLIASDKLLFVKSLRRIRTNNLSIITLRSKYIVIIIKQSLKGVSLATTAIPVMRRKVFINWEERREIKIPFNMKSLKGILYLRYFT